MAAFRPRLDEELTRRLDAVRPDDVPRERFARRLIERAVERLEAGDLSAYTGAVAPSHATPANGHVPSRTSPPPAPAVRERPAVGGLAAVRTSEHVKAGVAPIPRQVKKPAARAR
jgi:hypothetical protein